MSRVLYGTTPLRIRGAGGRGGPILGRDGRVRRPVRRGAKREDLGGGSLAGRGHLRGEADGCCTVQHPPCRPITSGGFVRNGSPPAEAHARVRLKADRRNDSSVCLPRVARRRLGGAFSDGCAARCRAQCDDGVQCSVPDAPMPRCPGPRHQAPGTRHQAPGTRHQARRCCLPAPTIPRSKRVSVRRRDSRQGVLYRTTPTRSAALQRKVSAIGMSSKREGSHDPARTTGARNAVRGESIPPVKVLYRTTPVAR
jgi:hypothetical protein